MSSFYLSILLLPGQHHVKFRSVHIYDQSIHSRGNPDKFYKSSSANRGASILLPSFMVAFFRGSHTTNLVTFDFSKSYNQAAQEFTLDASNRVFLR